MFNLFKKKNLALYGVVKGRYKSQEKIPDEVFSKGIMGATFAIEPEDNEIFAPFDCKISSIFPSKHAICLETDKGIEIIIHVGIDTVKLKGENFNVLVKEGQTIKKGDKLLIADMPSILNKGYKTDVIVIITKSNNFILNDVDSVDNNVIIGYCE